MHGNVPISSKNNIEKMATADSIKTEKNTAKTFAFSVIRKKLEDQEAFILNKNGEF